MQTQGACAHRMCNDTNISFNPNYYFEDFNPGPACAAGWKFDRTTTSCELKCGVIIDGYASLNARRDRDRRYIIGWVLNKFPLLGNVGFEARFRFVRLGDIGAKPIMIGSQTFYNNKVNLYGPPYVQDPDNVGMEDIFQAEHSPLSLQFSSSNGTGWQFYQKGGSHLNWYVVRWLYDASSQIVRTTVWKDNTNGVKEYDESFPYSGERPQIISTGSLVKFSNRVWWPDYAIDYVRTFNFVVAYDTDPPILNIGADITIDGIDLSGISYSVTKATATDNEDPNPVIIGKVNSQTGQTLTYPYLFPGGVTTIWWKATDISGNFTWKSQKVTVNLDSTPPAITNTSDINIDQQDATGANWNGPFPIITDDQDPNPVLSAHFNSQTAGAMTFPYHFLNGTSTIWWKGQDKNGNIAWKAQKVVVVQDLIAPMITGGGNVMAEQETASGTSIALATPTVADKNSYTLEKHLGNTAWPIINFPYIFPLGISTVVWTAVDKFGNKSLALQLVEIIDSTKPVLSPPDDIIHEAIDPNGDVIDIGTAIGLDICDSNVRIVNNGLSSFRVGNTPVLWTATDNSGNAVNFVQSINVVDTTKPVFSELDIIENQLPSKIISPSSDQSCIQIQEIESLLRPMVEDNGNFPDELSVSIISIDSVVPDQDTCLNWSVIPYFLCWQVMDVSNNFAQACQYVRIKEPSIIIDVAYNVDLQKNPYVNQDVIIDAIASGAGNNPTFIVTPEPDQILQNGNTVRIIYSNEQIISKGQIVVSSSEDWGFYSLRPFAIDKTPPEIIIDAKNTMLESLTANVFFRGEDIPLDNIIAVENSGAVKSGMKEYSLELYINNLLYQISNVNAELMQNQMGVEDLFPMFINILCYSMNSVDSFCTHEGYGISATTIYSYNTDSRNTVTLTFAASDVAGNTTVKDYSLLVKNYYQALLNSKSKIQQFQGEILFSYEQQEQLNVAKRHLQVASEYELINYHEGSYLRSEKAILILENIQDVLSERLDMYLFRALKGDIFVYMDETKKSLSNSILSMEDKTIFELAECHSKEADYWFDKRNIITSVQKMRLAYHDLALLEPTHVTQRLKKFEADNNKTNLSKVSNAVKNIDILIMDIENDIFDVLNVAATNGRNELEDVIDAIEVVSNSCIGNLSQFTLGDNHFMECYILINNIAKNLNTVAESLVSSHYWKTGLALSLFTLLDTSLFLSPTSLSQIAKDGGYLDITKQQYDPQLQLAIDTYYKALVLVENSQTDEALSSYVNGKCLMLELYHRYYSTRRVIPNKADPPDPVIIDSDCQGSEYGVSVSSMNHNPIIQLEGLSELENGVKTGKNFSLSALLSNDLDGQSLQFHWHQDIGLPIAISDDQSAVAFFSAPKQLYVNSALAKIDLIVTDSLAGCSYETIPITIIPSDPCEYENVNCNNINCITNAACNSPPSSTCLDDTYFIQYQSVGVCDIGVCKYPALHIPCEFGCDSINNSCKEKTCDDINCDTPPNFCYQNIGTCDPMTLSCDYSYDNGKFCNDFNPCTINDQCDTGICSGNPKTCNTPPPDACISNTILRKYLVGNCTETGECEYSYTDSDCGASNICDINKCVALGSVKWSYSTGDKIYSSPSIANDGTIYFGGADKYLYAFLPNGSLKWKFLAGNWIYSSPSIANDGTIYFGSFDKNIYALNPDGTLKWKIIMPAALGGSSPAIAVDGTIYVGVDDGNLYALNSDGTIKWKYMLSGRVRVSPALANDGTIYANSDLGDSYLHAINPNGTLKWKYKAGHPNMSSPSIANDGTIYFSAADKNLYAIKSDGTLKWKYTTGNEMYSTPSVAVDGSIYVGSYDNHLYAINQNGTLKWKYLTGSYIVASPALSADGNIFFGSHDGYFYSLKSDGTLQWKYNTGYWVYSSATIAKDGTVYVGSFNYKFYAFYGNSPLADSSWPKFHQNNKNTGRKEINCAVITNICNFPPANTCADNVTLRSYDATGFCGNNGHCEYSYKDSLCNSNSVCYQGSCQPVGNLKWKFRTTNGDLIQYQPAIAPDGTIYIGSWDHNLYALSPYGLLKWKFNTGNAIASDAIVGADGTIYVGSQDKYLYAVNPNGTLKWKFLTGDVIFSTPSISVDGTVYVGSLDNFLYAINSNGTLKWKYVTGSRVWVSPSIASDGTVYFGSKDFYIYSLAPDGTLKWKFLTKDAIMSSPAIGEDGTLYVGSYDKNLYALNPNGTLKWKFATGHYIYSSPSIGKDSVIYFGSLDRFLYALNPDGSVKWKYLTGGFIYSSPTITAEDTIIFGSFDKYIYGLSLDGIMKWKFLTGREVASSASIAQDGTIIIGSYDSYLYALFGNSLIADTPWPKFHQNNQNTGRK